MEIFWRTLLSLDHVKIVFRPVWHKIKSNLNELGGFEAETSPMPILIGL